jgi:hypothetical protein
VGIRAPQLRQPKIQRINEKVHAGCKTAWSAWRAA